MGMLDDAIREHLELKRRSGAAEEEVAQLEAEVLRQPVEPEPAEPVAPAPVEPVAEDAIAPAGPEVEELIEDAPAVHEVVPAFTAEEPWLQEDEPAAAGETSEFTAEELAEAAGGEPAPEYVAPDEEVGEDVLEETPDFLQETPEHDRLWFEQKPPRDFDFDG